MSGRAARLWLAGGVVTAAAAVAGVIVFTGDAPAITATVQVLAESVDVISGGTTAAAVGGHRLAVGDTVRTGADGLAVIEYSDDSVTRLDHDTEFTIVALGPTARPRVVEGRLVSGNSYHRVVGIVEAGSRFDVATPNATVSVQGTVYAVFVAPDGSTTIAVIVGAVGVAGAEGVTVTTGFMVTVGPDGSIVGPVPIPAGTDFEDWILYNRCDLDDECDGGGLPPPVFDHLEIAPAASEILAGAVQEYTVTAVDAAGAAVGDLTADALITGPSCVGAVCTPTVAGNYAVTASYGGSVVTSTLAVVSGPLAAIRLAPMAATVVAGLDQSFAAEGLDAFGNPTGAVGATLGMDGGACSESSCSSTVAGEYSVTATYDGYSSSARLTVAPGPLADVEVSPASATVTAGNAQTFSTTGYDAFGNSRGEISAVFTIGGVECDGPSCSSNLADEHPIVASFGGYTATAILQVVPGPLAAIVVYPKEATVDYYQSVVYSAIGFDDYWNYRGPVAATFGISGVGWCQGSTCGAYTPGTYTVTGYFAGLSANATLNVN